VDGKNIFDLMR